MAILDGQLAAVPSMNMDSVLFTQIPVDIVLKFTQQFPAWNAVNALYSPADMALALCGSTLFTKGMVVASSSLNSIKTEVDVTSVIELELKTNYRIPIDLWLPTPRCRFQLDDLLRRGDTR